MPEILDRVIVLNLVANTVIFYVAARLYLLPLIPRVRPQQILVPILLLHSTRHLGVMFLTRGATYPGLPQEFAYPAAFGDLITAIIAFAAIPFVLRRSGLAKPIVWAFNVFRMVALLAAITSATIYNAPVAMGPAYWIPAVAVPLLLVAHYVTFVLLLRRWGKRARGVRLPFVRRYDNARKRRSSRVGLRVFVLQTLFVRQLRSIGGSFFPSVF